MKQKQNGKMFICADWSRESAGISEDKFEKHWLETGLSNYWEFAGKCSRHAKAYEFAEGSEVSDCKTFVSDYVEHSNNSFESVYSAHQRNLSYWSLFSLSTIQACIRTPFLPADCLIVCCQSYVNYHCEKVTSDLIGKGSDVGDIVSKKVCLFEMGECLFEEYWWMGEEFDLEGSEGKCWGSGWC